MSPSGNTRTSGIPTPGKPTAGRLRSYSSSASTHEPLPVDFEASNRAFVDAIKANDPARYSGRSVSANNAVQRPSSVASNSRPKTPSGPFNRNSHRRSESRQSDIITRAQDGFTVGDNVRIESLGFEGTLRYIGEIAGKAGEWAGVELSGGFTGLGKNNGSVGNVRYFSCPEKCGVFIAYSKLSPPTVLPRSRSRPSSVASSRASLTGRITPSYTGRSTSSLHNGRVTPSLPAGSDRVTPAKSNGRITPSSSIEFSSSMARAAQKPAFHAPPSLPNTPSASAMSKITAGSRASKYVGMTAQQLSARSQKTMVPSSPSRTNLGLGSPTRLRGPPSPSRSESRNSLGGTPKPNTRLSLGTPRGFGSGRPSLTTPKARIPSAVAMPPPPSPPNAGGGLGRSISLNDKPATPTFSTTSNETAVDDDGIESLASIQNNSRALKDKIQSLLSSKSHRAESPSQPSPADVFQEDPVFRTPNSDISLRLMQDRVDSLERENSQLKTDLEETRSYAAKTGEIDALAVEREQALDRLQQLESQLKLSERTIDERNSKIESLERSVQASSAALQILRAEGDGRVKDLQTKLDDSQLLISSLKDAIEVKSNEAGQNEGVIQAKDAEIGLLEARVKKATSDLDDVRRDLSGQIDELRHAGQETIALYEERLGAAESKRYQLEDLVGRLEEQLKRRGSLTRSKDGVDQNSAEATRIDNEALRDQVVHLQSRIANLEDILEETRGNIEKEESAARSRLQRHKENEASLRAELTEARSEIERLSKSESFARGKAEEAEEALRENTFTLENAQAEIEGLRAEIVGLESLQARNSTEKTRTEESSRMVAIERERHQEELAQLKDLLEAARAARKEAVRDLDAAKQNALNTSNSMSSLRQAVENLGSEKAELEHTRTELATKLEREQSVVAELRRVLDDKTSELESSRKTLNRDRPINVGLQDVSASSTPSKQDSSGYREEIKGLKHIVQELQKEISTLSARNKMLESENKMLIKETDSLRQELKILEENVEQDLLDEERALSSEGGQPPTNGDAQLKARNNVEIERLRKQLAETEKKSTRTIHELNKEVNELESLIEAKIYREDELEREIERLRQKSSKRPSKSSIELPVAEPRHHHSSTSSTGTINGSEAGVSVLSPTSSAASAPDARSDRASGVGVQESEVCEICEQPGHDIFTCPLLKDGSEAPPPSGPGAVGERRGSKPVETDLFCEDCEGHGHLAADCPYSSDVF